MSNSKFSVGSMDFVIDIKPSEIAITTGKFYEMRKNGQFVKSYADPDDTIKLYGITADGKVYVSEKDDFDKTDEEFESWRRRAGCDLSGFKFLTLKESIEDYKAHFEGNGRASR